MSNIEQISKLLLEVVAERFEKEPLLTKGLEFGDSFAELLEKFVILHIRCWKIEDAIGETTEEVKVVNLKNKLDFCFKVKRPKLIAAINSFLDVYISKEHTKAFTEENVKLYKGFK